jgi:hypothetical protein
MFGWLGGWEWCQLEVSDRIGGTERTLLKRVMGGGGRVLVCLISGAQGSGRSGGSALCDNPSQASGSRGWVDGMACLCSRLRSLRAD